MSNESSPYSRATSSAYRPAQFTVSASRRSVTRTPVRISAPQDCAAAARARV
jgi:hypothetical protein